MGIFAAKSIRRGEEVTFNYQFQPFGAVIERCMCGSKNCTGNFGGAALEGQSVSCGGAVVTQPPKRGNAVEAASHDANIVEFRRGARVSGCSCCDGC